MSISWSLDCFSSAVHFITLDLLINFDQICRTYGLFPDGFVVAVWIVRISHSRTVLKYFLCSKQNKSVEIQCKRLVCSNFSWKQKYLKSHQKACACIISSSVLQTWGLGKLWISLSESNQNSEPFEGCPSLIQDRFVFQWPQLQAMPTAVWPGKGGDIN